MDASAFWAAALDLKPGPVGDDGRFRVLGSTRCNVSPQVAQTAVTARTSPCCFGQREVSLRQARRYAAAAVPLQRCSGARGDHEAEDLDHEQRFEFGLACVLDGIASRLPDRRPAWAPAPHDVARVRVWEGSVRYLMPDHTTHSSRTETTDRARTRRTVHRHSSLALFRRSTAYAEDSAVRPGSCSKPPVCDMLNIGME
jgi:hypothetical protein